MRLYDTATRGLAGAARAARARSGCTSAARPSTSGSTSATRGPFVISMWLRALARAHRLRRDARRQHHGHQRQDLRRRRPGTAPSSPRRRRGWYLEDTERPRPRPPDHEPKATETIPQIVALIEELVERGHAYAGRRRRLLPRLAASPTTGSSRAGTATRTRSGTRPRRRSRASCKEDPRDFALWKAHKEGEDTWWDSPWGRGRPGWHIECSAMAEKLFGPVFEIHGGGLDLVFPHHENEIAQSRALGHEFAQIWMHNGMLRFAGEKMSKSLGNIVSLRDALDTWGRETLLVYFLGGHWRKPIDFSDETLEQAAAQAEGFRNVFRGRVRARRATGSRSRRRSTTTSTRPRRWRSCTGGATTSCCGAGLEIFGLESLAESEAAPAELDELARRRAEARAAARLRRGRPAARRDRGRGWEVRDVEAEPGFQLVPKR